MTVSSSTARADYNGNGSTTAFTVPFYFLNSSHLLVISTVIATGVSTTLVLNSDYTVTGTGVPSGGTVTTSVAPVSGVKLSILRNVPITQTYHYVPNDPFPAASHENALDLLTMEVQQVNEVTSRAIVLSQATSGVSTYLPTASSNSLLGWNNAATALVNYTQTTGIAASPFMASFMLLTDATSGLSALSGVSKTSSTGSQVTPSGTSAQRDGSPAFGYSRGNTDLVRMEWWNGTAWTAMGGGATGGGVDTAFVENDTLITTNYTLGQGALISGVTVVAATDIFTLTAHGFVAGQLVQFSSTTTLPAPLLAQTGYYVIATNLTANTFMVSTAQGGATVDITTTGTGTHSVGKLKNAVTAGPVTIADGVSVNIPTNATWSIV